jgi:hypothetical protein
MTDRELLEAAAKAAGIHWENWTPTVFAGEAELREWPYGWNPLADDGDALRLAVKLKFKVTIGWDNPTLVTVEWIERHEDGWAVKELEGGQENDPLAATRRAIVRAAAALGERDE